MSLAKIFGGNKKGAAPTTQEAIQKLRETEEMLIKKTEFLEKKIEGETKIAKTNASKNKRAAIAALKRKKRLEKQFGQIDGTLYAIELQRESLENAKTNIETVKALDYGRQALAQAHKQIDADGVSDMVEMISDEMYNANEIQDALAGMSGAFGEDMDEDELNAELEALEQEDFDEQMISVNTPAAELPDVPTTDLPSSSKTKNKQPVADADDDMAALEAWGS